MKESRNYYIYFMTNTSRTVLYVGITNDLKRRIKEHKEKKIKGFTSKYNCTKLVYYEHSEYIINTLEREKQIKKWSRKKKNFLVEISNPNWRDLSNSVI